MLLAIDLSAGPLVAAVVFWIFLVLLGFWLGGRNPAGAHSFVAVTYRVGSIAVAVFKGARVAEQWAARRVAALRSKNAMVASTNSSAGGASGVSKP